FTEENVPFVAEILAFFCLAMITHSTVTIMNRAFYAAQDTRTPLAAGLVSVILNLALGYVFYRHTDLGAAGMALSYSLISLVNSFILLVLNVKKLKGIDAGELAAFLLRAVMSAAVMSAVLWGIREIVPYPGEKASQLVYLVLEIIAGCAVYLA